MTWRASPGKRRGDRSGHAGVSSPRTTPASVACTPDSSRREPDERADGEVGGEALHVAAAQGEDHGEADAASQPTPGQRAGVEDGDHDDRADVVGDGQGEQEDLRRDRHPPPESVTMPTAKAMSVAMGIAQPSAPALPRLSRE